jgi:hypothetical protein
MAWLQLGRPMGVAPVHSECSTIRTHAPECARRATTRHGQWRAETARLVMRCTSEGSSTLSTPAWQQGLDQLASKNRSSERKWLTGGLELAWRWWSTVRAGRCQARSCMMTIASWIPRNTERRMRGCRHGSSSKRCRSGGATPTSS